jgi:hypothetical protein
MTDERWHGLAVARSIADAGPRQRLVSQGSVRRVSVRTSPWLRCEVDVDDGTGVVRLCFMGRRGVPGVEPGATIAFEGTTQAARADTLLVLNPLIRVVTAAPRHEPPDR